MAAKLIIDMGKCKEKADPSIRCSYKHHPGNEGFKSLLEMIRFSLICRKCDTAPCVKACPQDALEKIQMQNNGDSILRRANMLCTGCGTCAIACPFGTIYTDLIPYPSSVCDLCRGRLVNGEKPLCVQTCTDGSVDYRDIAVEGDFVEVFDGIVAKVPAGTLWEPFLGKTER